MIEEENFCITQCIDAYAPMLQAITLSSKIEMYQAIYNKGLNATDEMLSLGVAITADPEFQQWMNARLASSIPKLR